MNKIILIGRVGGDPIVKEVGTSKVCKFSLATSESYTKNGEKVTETEWHNLVFWGKPCDIIQKWVHKGDMFSVTGKVKTRKYDDKDGITHYATEVVCNEFEFISSGNKDQHKPENNEGKIQKGGKVSVTSMSDISELGYQNTEEIPDGKELPF